MKTWLCIIGILLLSGGCCDSKNKTIDLSTPEATLKSYYQAFKKKSGFEYQKKMLWNPSESSWKKRYDIVEQILVSYQIIQIRAVKKREYSFYKAGDVTAVVKEVDKFKRVSINAFILRKFKKDWLLIDFVTENKAEEPQRVLEGK